MSRRDVGHILFGGNSSQHSCCYVNAAYRGSQTGTGYGYDGGSYCFILSPILTWTRYLDTDTEVKIRIWVTIRATAFTGINYGVVDALGWCYRGNR